MDSRIMALILLLIYLVCFTMFLYIIGSVEQYRPKDELENPYIKEIRHEMFDEGGYFPKRADKEEENESSN